MHPQTAAWLKDLDFTDSEEVYTVPTNSIRTVLFSELILTSLLQMQDTQSDHSERAENANFDSPSSLHGLTLPSLPAEVLFTVIDLLDLPALASFAQTCKDVRAICLLDSVWDRLCDGKGGQQGPHPPNKYHKPRRSHSTDFRKSALRQTAPYASTDTVQPQQHTATFKPPCEEGSASTHAHSQVRYTYFDHDLRLRYSSGLVVDPSWLSLLPRVSSQGSSWLYVKAKTLSGAATVCMRQHSASLQACGMRHSAPTVPQSQHSHQSAVTYVSNFKKLCSS